jgi:hypothetical protein
VREREGRTGRWKRKGEKKRGVRERMKVVKIYCKEMAELFQNDD